MLLGNNSITNTLFQRRTYLLIMKNQELSGKLSFSHQVKCRILPNVLPNSSYTSLLLNVRFFFSYYARNSLHMYNHHYSLGSYGTYLQILSLTTPISWFQMLCLEFWFLAYYAYPHLICKLCHNQDNKFLQV